MCCEIACNEVYWCCNASSYGASHFAMFSSSPFSQPHAIWRALVASMGSTVGYEIYVRVYNILVYEG